MLAKPDCIPCYLKQAVSTLRVTGIEEHEINYIIYNIMDMIPGLSLNATPCENSSLVLQKIYELIKNPDPYYGAKKMWNQYIVERFPYFEELMNKSQERVFDAFKIAAAGNIIDMGITPDFDINIALKEITEKDFDLNDYPEFVDLLKQSKRILIIGDNSGEIVFDKVLVGELIRQGLEVAYAVKEYPILNDATMEDAREVGMTDLCEVITTGNKILGISPKLCSEAFLQAFEKADIVISKGQANYESLEGTSLAGGKTFFVLRAKCQSVADCLEVKLGDIVLKRNRAAVSNMSF